MTARTKQQLYDRFCSTGSAKRSISQFETNYEDLIDTVYGNWIDYSAISTVTGWASYGTKKIYYRNMVNMVYVDVDIAGTSNANTASITVPYTCTSDIGFVIPCVVHNNGAWSFGLAKLTGNTSTVNFYIDIDSTVWHTSAANKTVYCKFWYEVA